MVYRLTLPFSTSRSPRTVGRTLALGLQNSGRASPEISAKEKRNESEEQPQSRAVNSRSSRLMEMEPSLPGTWVLKKSVPKEKSDESKEQPQGRTVLRCRSRLIFEQPRPTWKPNRNRHPKL